MSLRSWIFLWVVLGLSAPSFAQILNYTETQNGPAQVAIGYPVPEPVDSLTAIDGFRSYVSLHAQHQDLLLTQAQVAGEVVGLTHLNREIWAYVLGDTDSTTWNGLPEPAVLINGGIHAREWASPEVVTELFEQLVEGQSDQGLVQYLMENVNTVIVPVMNVDGFVQTQSYPTEFTPTPPGVSNSIFAQPRDGRMRRKNMRGVDEDLSTDFDRLLGIDLNRNNAQFFDDGGNSTDPTSLVYRGTAPASEPETQALYRAAELAPEDRLRFYVDVHSFSRVFFIPSPLNSRQNSNTSRLVDRLSAVTGVDPRYPAYFPVFNEPNTGISGTAAMFAHTYNIPAWTLEIEPPNGFPGIPNAGAFYGGFGVSHDGFILPDREIDRVRDELTRMHLLALYHQAGPPAAQAIEIRDAGDSVVYQARWETQADGSRVLNTTVNQVLNADGSQYRLWLAFDKPMRFFDGNQIADYPGQSVLQTRSIATLTGDSFSVPVSFSVNDWLTQSGGAPNGYLNYQTDAISGTFSLPQSLTNSGQHSASVSIDVSDMGGLLNDANPATSVDFVNGGWTGYENGNGFQGDNGGVDRSFAVSVQVASPAQPTPGSNSGGGGVWSWPLSLLILLGGTAYWNSRYCRRPRRSI